MTDTTAGGFGSSDVPTAEIDRIEALFEPLAESVRGLLDAVIRSTVDDDVVADAIKEIDAVTARLRDGQLPGAAGVHFNAEGRAWNWGNAAVGVRNAVAPPLLTEIGPDGVVHGRAELGAAYEGPPGRVHGGVLALLIDHLLGLTASAGRRPAMTGTLTMRYRRPTPLGPIRLEGRIERMEGVKTFVHARVFDAEGLTAEADGIFILPRWARGKTWEV